MSRATIFQFAAIWHPTAKQIKDEDLKSIFIIEPETILAKNAEAVKMKAVMLIPQEYADELEQVDVVVRPF